MVFLLENRKITAPIKILPKTARGISPAASIMPTAMLQNKKAISRGSLIAVRKRTMDNAPTMPRESTTLLTTVMIKMVVIKARAIRVVPKLAEYITLLQLFL